MLDLNWTEALLVGAVVASTDAAAVFLLVHAQGLRLRPRVGATLEVESGTNDPFAVFLTLVLVEFMSIGESSAWQVALQFAREAVLGAIIGVVGGRLVVLALNRVALPQGLHAPFVATARAGDLRRSRRSAHASGFLAVYLAGIIIGNRPTRAHNSVVTFLDAATWLAQIVMFVLLGLLVSPQRLVEQHRSGASIVALVLMLVARPVAVFLCLAPFRFNWREKIFIAWTGLRGAVAIFLASIPMLVGLSKAYLYFDVAFVVVIISLLLQGWTLGVAARQARTSRCRAPIAGRGASSSICPASSSSRWSAIRSSEKPVFPARADSILVEADAGDPRPADSVARRGRSGRARAITSICWRRRKRPSRWTASSSICRRARRPIRICSAISWSPAKSRLAIWLRSMASTWMPSSRN